MFQRWTKGRKADLLRQLQAGLVTRAQLIAQYDLSEEELAEWERRYQSAGEKALRASVCPADRMHLRRPRDGRGRPRRYDVVLLALVLLTSPAWAASERPYSCRLLDDEQKKCAMMQHGTCDKRVLERLTRECLKDGGRP